MPQTVHLKLALTAEQYAMLHRAALAAGTTLESFVLNSACQVAEKALFDRDVFLLDSDQAAAFTALLDRPPRDNPGLWELLPRFAPWAQ